MNQEAVVCQPLHLDKKYYENTILVIYSNEVLSFLCHSCMVYSFTSLHFDSAVATHQHRFDLCGFYCMWLRLVKYVGGKKYGMLKNLNKDG